MLPLDLLQKEITIALRALRRAKSVTAISVLLLALGVGLTSAVFTLLWQAIYAQLPVTRPSEIWTFASDVTHNGRSENDAMSQTWSTPMYRYLAANLHSSAGLIARRGEKLNVETPAGNRHLLGEFVSGNYFPVLGVQPILGRTLQPGDDQPSGNRFVAVLSYEFWKESFGGSESLWNSKVEVNAVSFRVVGVMRPNWKGLIAGQVPQLYFPITTYADANKGWHGDTDWGLRWLNAFVRLPNGWSRPAAEAELQNVYRAGVRQELASEGAQSPEYLRELSHEHLKFYPASRGDRGALEAWDAPLHILQWMALAVLLLVAVNVAGLLLVKAINGRRSILIRYAVGGTQAAIVRLQVWETLLLSLAGGLLGLWLARGGAAVLVHMARMNAEGSNFQLSPHGWTLSAHWLVVIVAALAIAILPAWHSAHLNVAQGLNEGASSHSGSIRDAWTRRCLAAAQLALSLLLLTTAGLFAQALHALVSVPVGFQPEHLLTFAIDAKGSYSDIAKAQQLWANLSQHLESRGDVTAASYGTGGPFPHGSDAAVLMLGSSTANPQDFFHQSGTRSMIGPGYFRTLGIGIVSGREFTNQDGPGSPKVLIVNQNMARKLFGTNNPIGQTVTIFNGLDANVSAVIVGVVADHSQSWVREQKSLIYTPAQQATRTTEINFYVRTKGSSFSEDSIRQLLRREAPSLTPYSVTSMRSRMDDFASNERALAILVSAFAVVALCIAAIGIYGVVSYSASLRSVEFGVRVALGATASDIGKLLLREGVLILGTGVSLGVPLTFVALLALRHGTETVTLNHPWIYTGALSFTIIGTLTALLLPIKRGRRTSIRNAIRHL